MAPHHTSDVSLISCSNLLYSEYLCDLQNIKAYCYLIFVICSIVFDTNPNEEDVETVAKFYSLDKNGTSCSAERYFSSLQRSTMGQERLTNLALCSTLYWREYVNKVFSQDIDKIIDASWIQESKFYS